MLAFSPEPDFHKILPHSFITAHVLKPASAFFLHPFITHLQSGEVLCSPGWVFSACFPNPLLLSLQCCPLLKSCAC